MVEVPLIIGDVLEIPDDRPGIGVQGQRGIGVQHVAVAGAALHGAPGNRHPDTRIDQVQLRVVAGRIPGRAAAPILVRDVAPAVVAELALAGNGVRTPHLLAGIHVMGRDPAAGVQVIAAGHAGDDAPLDYHRTAGIVLANGPVAHLHVPFDLARTGVQGHEVRIVGADEQLVPVERTVAADAGERSAVLHLLAAVLPDARTVADVHRLDEVARLHQEHHAVVDQRRRFLTALRHRPGPRQAQAAHVGRVDLVEGAVPPVAVGPPPHQPVAGRRADQHLLGHGLIVARAWLRRRGCAREQQDDDDTEPTNRRSHLFAATTAAPTAGACAGRTCTGCPANRCPCSAAPSC